MLQHSSALCVASSSLCLLKSYLCYVLIGQSMVKSRMHVSEGDGCTALYGLLTTGVDFVAGHLTTIKDASSDCSTHAQLRN